MLCNEEISTFDKVNAVLHIFIRLMHVVTSQAEILNLIRCRMIRVYWFPFANLLFFHQFDQRSDGKLALVNRFTPISVLAYIPDLDQCSFVVEPKVKAIHSFDFWHSICHAEMRVNETFDPAG